MGFYAVLEKVIIIKLKGKPYNFAIIQMYAYAPTSGSTEEDIDRFYSEVEEAKKQCGLQEMVIFMGNLNAKSVKIDMNQSWEIVDFVQRMNVAKDGWKDANKMTK